MDIVNEMIDYMGSKEVLFLNTELNTLNQIH